MIESEIVPRHTMVAQKVSLGMKILQLLLILILVLTLPQVSIADMYQWTDEQGKIHFTDSIKKVPKRYRPEADRQKQKDIPPFNIPEEPPVTELDAGLEVLEKDELQVEIKGFNSMVEQEVAKSPPWIVYTGQQSDSQWVEIVNGGIKYIRTLGVGLTLTLLNEKQEPVWVKLKFEAGPECRYGDKLDPGQPAFFFCRVNANNFPRNYLIKMAIFDNEKRFRLPWSPGFRHKPETHTIKFKYGYKDKQKLDKIIEARLGDVHRKIQSEWIDITFGRITTRAFSTTLRPKFLFGLDLKNKTMKEIWVTVEFGISGNKKNCIFTKKIGPKAKKPFLCRHRGAIYLNKSYPVQIVVYKNEKDAVAAKFPKETLETSLGIGE